MKLIKYFIQFLTILTLFLIFKILGLKLATLLSSKIMYLIGPLFRSQSLINSNILKALPNSNQEKVKNISKRMWGNYGKILAEYVFIKDFRESKLNKKIKVKGQEILDEIKKIMNL